jgi:hypothetical protein
MPDLVPHTTELKPGRKPRKPKHGVVRVASDYERSASAEILRHLCHAMIAHIRIWHRGDPRIMHEAIDFSVKMLHDLVEDEDFSENLARRYKR